MDLFDNISLFDLGDSDDSKDTERIADERIPEEEPAHVRVYKRQARNTYRRAFSETQLLDCVLADMPFQDGESYHFISGGDVDALSYLKLIIRQQPLDYLLLSTWCMAGEDICQLRDWNRAGKIKKMDAYVGEIFPGTYKKEYAELKPVIKKAGGRVCVFRNHSKIFAGTGPLFSFGIESSSNINTNPRTENACITIDRGLFEFYKEFYDGVVSFE